MECRRSTDVFFTFACALALLSFHLKPCNGAREGPKESTTSTDFVRTSCGATEYPALCFSSLSAYAATIQSSPAQLADVALSVTLARARSASAALARAVAGGGMAPRVAAAVRDCVENMADAVDELRESLAAMGHVMTTAARAGGKKTEMENVAYLINSIQTWVSAALTDDDTCMDGFAGGAMNGEVKDKLRSHVVNVAQLSSNALALINGLASSLPRP
ncbi:hypothetical protein Cni_G08796 [Canna indica]|uniref:Pectinesterase inhibitor domain-containing protein n=1 Tax=Canna indica TaxID=4628 RepID=A0AAQ3K3I1_9LILI|nr:hypothetical protein Cni_G08796 [Canna indica]